MADEGNPGGWEVENCYVLERMQDADAIPKAQRQAQDDGTICYFIGNTTIRVNETMVDGKVSLELIAGDQVACGEWSELSTDRLHGYGFLLEKYLNGGENP